MSGSATWTLLNGGPLWLAALAALLVLAVAGSLWGARGLHARRRTALVLLRLAALLLVAAAVLRPAREVDLVRSVRPPLAVVVDTSASMQLGEPPLATAAQEWLRGAAGDLERLAQHYRVDLYALADPPVPLSAVEADTVVGTAAVGEGGGAPLQRSPIAKTLRALAQRHPDLAGVLLLSDGRDTDHPGQPPAALAVPVYPLVPAEPPVPDLWIEAVQIPPVGFIRTPVEVRVQLRSSQLPAAEVEVLLLEEGRLLASQPVTLGAAAEVGLHFTPTRTGRRAYRVEVAPQAGEVTAANNRRQFMLSVVRDKTRVLLVAGTPTWDVKFLRRRLRQDPGIDLITFLILRTPQDLSAVPQQELSLIPFPTRELFSEELPSFDAVIFANFDYAPYVPAHYLRNLVDFVRESGGGFAMLGGDRSLSLGGYVDSPLDAILPVDAAGAAPGAGYRPGTFRPRLTTTGAAHPLFQWRGRTEENALLWNQLPELEGTNWVLRARPEAVVLVENPQARNEYGAQPLVTLGEYGKGRTLVVATDSLWHWALPNAGVGGDASVYRDFWTRALRWLVHDPEMELVRLAQPPAPLRMGATVRFRARVLDRTYRPVASAEVTGYLQHEAGPRRPLAWSAAAPGEYVSEPFELQQQGLWRVALEAHSDGVFLGRDAAAFPVEGASLEAEQVGLDLAYLEGLAAASGGRLVRGRGDELLDSLLRRGRERVEVVGRRVEEGWATGWLLALSVALFAAEWALRRWWE